MKSYILSLARQREFDLDWKYVHDVTCQLVWHPIHVLCFCIQSSQTSNLHCQHGLPD